MLHAMIWISSSTLRISKQKFFRWLTEDDSPFAFILISTSIIQELGEKSFSFGVCRRVVPEILNVFASSLKTIPPDSTNVVQRKKSDEYFNCFFFSSNILLFLFHHKLLSLLNIHRSSLISKINTEYRRFRKCFLTQADDKSVAVEMD